ncbi:MAG: class A beta-lactamase-related serine hydrolase [Hyphomicrobiales bacterium]|nr:MAG: class A beta-lactamase-related serine hydrolase [Hyphomicrobiales bacterium]
MSDPFASPAHATTAGLTEHGAQRLVRVLEREIADRRLPGAVVMVGRGGRLGVSQALGKQGPEGDAPMRADSLFRIYSMTKPIVSVAVMKLVEEGRILLGDAITKYIPVLGDLKVAVQDGDSIVRLDPLVRPITIQDLLRHTSGFTYGFVATGEIARRYQEARLASTKLTNAEFCEKLATLPLLHQPGTHWSYSQSTDVLGCLLEVVHKKTLGEVLKAEVLDPLGMHDTSFVVPEEKLSRLAKPLPRDPDTGGAVTMLPTHNESGGGGLYGTAPDYARFCQMLANGGALGSTHILGRKTLEFMSSDHLAPHVVIDQNLGLLPPAHGFGLGFGVRRVTGVDSFPGTAGSFYWGGIAGTTFWIDPKEDLWALLMIQAPAQREYYRMLFRNLVYSALV